MKIGPIILIFLSLSLVACSEKQALQTVISTKSSEKKQGVRYAKNFELIDQGVYTELQIIDPEKNKIETRFALIPKGVKVKLSGDYIPISVPVEKLISLSSTHLGMISKLNATASIAGIANPNYIFNPYIKMAYEAGKIQVFPDFNSLNPEKVLASGANLIVYDGFGQNPQQMEKLAQLQIFTLANYDWRENDPLGKAEWIKVFGALLDKKTEAENYFNLVEKEYLRLKADAKKIKSTPEVLSGALIGDVWYIPQNENYGSKLIQDAHAQNVAFKEKGTKSAEFSLEYVLKNFRNTPFWINPNFPSEKEILAENNSYKYLRAFQEKKVYSYAHNMNYFWENSAIEPHLVLSDLIYIFHPKEAREKSLYFYEKIKLNE